MRTAPLLEPPATARELLLEPPEEFFQEEQDIETDEPGVCWKTANGRIVPVKRMEDDHLRRTIQMLVRTHRVQSRGAYREDGSMFATWTRQRWADYLGNEAGRRGIEVPV